MERETTKHGFPGTFSSTISTPEQWLKPVLRALSCSCNPCPPKTGATTKSKCSSARPSC
jgi:hypothetical protein